MSHSVCAVLCYMKKNLESVPQLVSYVHQFRLHYVNEYFKRYVSVGLHVAI